MAISSNETVSFNLDNVTDNQILVYDAATGSFKNETSAVSANANVTGQGRNVGSQGVGLYKQNDGSYLEFYKLQSGANTTLTLTDNVLFIDAVVGSGSTAFGSANANTVAVHDANGNVLNGSDSLTFDGTTFSFLGSSNNVTVADGLVTSNNLVTTNLTFAGVTLPTTDGTANQILVTNGANVVSWTNQQDITVKTDNTAFNAHVAQAMVTTASNAPALDNTYDLGNSTNKYNEVFSTYFRGTADLAVNATNLGSQPAANYRLATDSFTKAEVNALIANVDTANTSGLLSNISGTNGTTSFVQPTGAVDIRGDGNITVGVDTANKRFNIGLNASDIATRAFKTFAVSGQDNITADTSSDTITFVAGSGMTIGTNAAGDSITFASSGGGGSSNLTGLSDTPANYTGAAGKYLKVNSSANAIEFDTLSLTDLGISDGTTDQVLKTDGAGNFSFTNQTGGSTQTLTWNAGTYSLGISSGNNIDLSALAQDISLSGNVISLAGQTGNVDLTSTLAGVAGNYGDSNVATYLTNNSYATQTYVNTANTNVVAYVDNQVTLLKGGANVNLDSLAEVANALNNSNTQLSTVAFTGNHSDIQSRPTIALSGSDLTYDGTTLDLSGLGATGPQGPAGNTGATGSQGATGPQGTAGVGITSVSLAGSGNLTLNYSNSSAQDVGNIKGPQGDTGPAGGGAALTDFSVTTASASGSGSLAYNSGSGVYTFTPPDLSSFITSETDSQDLTISGNVISLTGQSGNVDLTSILGSTDIVSDTSPQLGGDLDVNGKDIVTTSNGNIDLDPNGSGKVVFKGNATRGAGQFVLNCENNSHGITLKGPPHSAAASYTLTLPNDDGSADQVLKTDGSGVLSWTNNSGGGASALNDLSDVSTSGAASGQVLKYNGSSWAPSADNTGGGGSSSFEYFKLYYTSAGAIDTTQGSGGYSDKSTNVGNVTINNAASNSCEVIVDFGGNYNFPPVAITAYGFSQSTSEYLIKGQSASVNNTTLKLAGSGSPHGSLGTSNVTLSLTRSETGSSSGFGQTTHAWIYFSMGS